MHDAHQDTTPYSLEEALDYHKARVRQEMDLGLVHELRSGAVPSSPCIAPYAEGARNLC
jgi:hypothetical protein